MSETPWQQVRIGDSERETAMGALGEHMGAGRLTVDEYGERSAKVAAARTRGELAELFTDLPDPRPRFGPAGPPQPEPLTSFAPQHSTPQYGMPQYGMPQYPHPPHHPQPFRRGRPPGRRAPEALTILVGVIAVGFVLFGLRWTGPFVLLPLVLLFVVARNRRRY